jgi:hypothetical protein
LEGASARPTIPIGGAESHAARVHLRARARMGRLRGGHGRSRARACVRVGSGPARVVSARAALSRRARRRRRARGRAPVGLLPDAARSPRADLAAVPGHGGVSGPERRSPSRPCWPARASSRAIFGARALELPTASRLCARGLATPPQSRIDLVMAARAERGGAVEGARRQGPATSTRKAGQSGLSRLRAAPPESASPPSSAVSPSTCAISALQFTRGASYEVAAEAFGDRLSIHLALLGDRSIGGLVAIDFAGTVTVPWASTLRAERARCPNNMIYWERSAGRSRAARAGSISAARRARAAPIASSSAGEPRSASWPGFDSRPARNRRHPPTARAAPAEAHVGMDRLPVGVATALGARLRLSSRTDGDLALFYVQSASTCA